MDRRVELTAGGQSLVLVTINELKWCQVYLKHGTMVKLGADRQDIVVNKLLSVLDPHTFPEMKHTREGVKYAFFLVLPEDRTWWLATKTRDRIALLILSDEQDTISEITLSHEDCRRWRSLLEDFNNTK